MVVWELSFPSTTNESWFARLPAAVKITIRTAEFAVFLEASQNLAPVSRVTRCTRASRLNEPLRLSAHAEEAMSTLRWTIILAGGTIAVVLGLWTGRTVTTAPKSRCQ
jgi:hypothetical protein